MERELICISCPMGCHLTVNVDEKKVTGNSCKRGEIYGLNEVNFEAIKKINKVTVKAPVKAGDVIVENILGTGVDVIASRSMGRIKN